MVLCAVGARPNNAMLRRAFHLTEQGRVGVDAYLRVRGHEDSVFCGGDLCDTDETKLGYTAAIHGTLIGRNIAHMATGEALDSYAPAPSTIMFVTLGPSGGAAQLPGGFVVGDTISAAIKSKTLFLPRYWDTFQVEPPSTTWW